MLERIKRRALRGGAMVGRFRRYLVTFGLGTAVIWALAIAYIVLTPKSYSSDFTLILPGTGAGSSVNLENLGQASTMSASAFATPDVSPTENYRKMLLSTRVLGEAAARAGIAPGAFPAPRIDLAEQTKLILISLKARSPELARTRAEALRQAFLHTLDTLRSDEIAARDNSNTGMMAGYRATLERARGLLIQHQVKSGLVSLEQYGNMVSGLEHLRETLRDTEVKLAQTRAGVAGLTKLLNTTPEAASLAMLLRADPIFQTGLDSLAKHDADIAALEGTRGDANARLRDLRAERAALAARLLARGAELTGTRRANILRITDLSLRDERARLFERLVDELADQMALEGTQARLSAQIAAEQARIVALAPEASRLDDLKRDVQVAEAVFSSALARLGTSKADFFASYPMVQTLEPPSLPARPSSPSRPLGLAGAAAADFFLALALVMTWLRTNLLQKLLKSAGSSTPSPLAGFGISWEHSM